MRSSKLRCFGLSGSVLLAALLVVSPAVKGVVITFEDIDTGGVGEGATAILDQYAPLGVEFRLEKVLDYSKGAAIPGFARSGTKAMEPCYGAEFCSSPVQMTFTALQSHVKVWVGGRGLTDKQIVVLRTFDGNGVDIRDAAVNLPIGTTPINQSLEVSLPSAMIAKATVGFASAESGGGDYGLAVDNVEFDVQGPPVQPTRIHVDAATSLGVSPSSGAEVFADGVLIGATDAAGNLDLNFRLAAGTKLAARKQVHYHNRSGEDIGRTGAAFYITSVPVNNDGTTPVQLSTIDPVQEIVVRVGNTLVGFDILASVEWDASDAELADLRDHFMNASQFLYNATDGQMLFQTVKIMDNHASWGGDSDYSIYGDQKKRSFVDGCCTLDPYYIHIARPPCVGCIGCDVFNPPGKSPWEFCGSDEFSTYIHEFGHYDFDLKDEYSDDDKSIFCTFLAGVGTSPPGMNQFQSGMPSASRIMFYQFGCPKFCSNRSENPHAHGTEEGDEPCWHEIVDTWHDGNTPPRWLLQTPDTRGAIVGTINGGSLPVEAWAPKISIQNTVRPNLCNPVNFVVVGGDGTPLPNKNIWLHTTYGQDILQGHTGPNGESISVTGLHVGDHVNTRTWTAADCGPSISSAISERSSKLAVTAVQIQAPPDPFNVFVSLEPGPVSGSAQVRVRAEALSGKAPVGLATAPAVEFSLAAQEQAQPVAMGYDAVTKSYVGSVDNLPGRAEAIIQVSATDLGNRTINRIESVMISTVGPPSRPNGSFHVFSPSGDLEMVIPTSALAVGTHVTIGSSPVKPPPLPIGFGFASEPVNLAASGAKPSLPCTIRFVGVSGFDPNTFEVLHYNPVTGLWDNLGSGVFLPVVQIVTFHTQQLGVFALVGHKAPPVQGPDVSDAVPTMAQLWPPDHKLVSVGISGVRAPAGGRVSITITKVSSDEDVSIKAKGDPCPDAIIDGATVRLRAERFAQGNGRVYTVYFAASDGAGHSNTGQVKVGVPVNQGSGQDFVDDGPAFNATSCDGKF
jgi:hypothetical protein